MLFPESDYVVRYKGTVPVVRVTGELRQVRYEPPRGALVNFDGARLVEVDFTNTRFHTFSASAGSAFERCDFRAMVAEGGGMGGNPQVTTVIATSRGPTCRHAWERPLRALHIPGSVQLEVLYGRVRGVSFSRPGLRGQLLRTAMGCRHPALRPLETPRTVNEFFGNDFADAELIDVSFMYGIGLWVQ
jgi:hypothetical protein